MFNCSRLVGCFEISTIGEEPCTDRRIESPRVWNSTYCRARSHRTNCWRRKIRRRRTIHCLTVLLLRNVQRQVEEERGRELQPPNHVIHETKVLAFPLAPAPLSKSSPRTSSTYPLLISPPQIVLADIVSKWRSSTINNSLTTTSTRTGNAASACTSTNLAANLVVELLVCPRPLRSLLVPLISSDRLFDARLSSTTDAPGLVEVSL
jgi:hypothetical protein